MNVEDFVWWILLPIAILFFTWIILAARKEAQLIGKKK